MTTPKSLPISCWLAIATALLAPFFIYFSTAQSIVSVWNQSETFAHGYIILPISLWLIWKRKEQLKHTTPQPSWWAILLLAAIGFAWLLAELGDVQVVRQYAFAAMIPAAAVVILGWEIAWSLAFPLLFILLAVPFGEIFIEPLINFTADFTVAALQLTGIPVLRDGTNFSIPSGNWSVIKACSGVRYLISSVTLGCLYAYLTYRSTWRRLAFVLISIIVPIIANGLRAYMIVMIGHLSGMTLAVGVDHLIYGWLFFGLVMFLMFWIGGFWRDDKLQTDAEQSKAVRSSDATQAPLRPRALFAASAAIIACLGLWPAYAAYISHLNVNQSEIALTDIPTEWKIVPSFTSWRPHYLSPAAELDRSFSHQQEQVGLLIKYYRNQTRESSVISSQNFLTSDEGGEWLKTENHVHPIKIGDQIIKVRESAIKNSIGERIIVWDWYWINGQFIANNYIGKILQTKGKLALKGDDAASIILYAPYGEHPEEARAALSHYFTSHFAAIESALKANKK